MKKTPGTLSGEKVSRPADGSSRHVSVSPDQVCETVSGGTKEGHRSEALPNFPKTEGEKWQKSNQFWQSFGFFRNSFSPSMPLLMPTHTVDRNVSFKLSCRLIMKLLTLIHSPFCFFHLRICFN